MISKKDLLEIEAREIKFYSNADRQAFYEYVEEEGNEATQNIIGACWLLLVGLIMFLLGHISGFLGALA